MVRASLDNPSHPPQEPWPGIPAQVLWAEVAQPISIRWLPWLIGGAAAAVLLIGMIWMMP